MNIQAMMKASSLLSELQGKTLEDLTPELVTKSLEVLGIKDNGMTNRVLALASESPSDDDLVAWLHSKYDDGSFHRMLQLPTTEDQQAIPDEVIIACPHCERPFALTLKT